MKNTKPSKILALLILITIAVSVFTGYLSQLVNASSAPVKNYITSSQVALNEQVIPNSYASIEAIISSTNVNLDFSSAISGTILDKDRQGTGFTSVQDNTAGNQYDLGLIDLNTSASTLVLTATQGSNTTTNTLKNGLQVAIDTKTQPFTISTRLKDPLTNLDTAFKQGGIFLGSNQNNYVKLVIINSSSGTNGLGLQFFQEQNGVRSSVGGGTGQQIRGLNWASINTLDLFLTGDPATGIIRAAYRINSNTATPTLLTQQFQPNPTTPFFGDSVTARAGILAFTVNAPDTTVTFDSFNFQLNPTKFTWSTVAPSPVQRTESVGAMADGKLYVFGGYLNATYRPTNRSDVYNPANNTWTEIKDLPTTNGISHVGIAVDGKNIYLAGGYLGTSTNRQIFATKDVWKYNADTNTYTTMPSLPEARGSGELALVGRELHFFGGVDINRKDKGDHWVLSLNGGTRWVAAASLPNPRSHMGDVVLNGKIYAIGGQHDTDENLVTQTSVHVWDPAKPNTWTAVAPLPRGRSHISGSTFVMDNRIIVVGGEIAHTRSVSDVTAYDPLSNSWQVLTPLPAARYSGVAGSIGNQIFYTTGGFTTTTYKGVPVSR